MRYAAVRTASPQKDLGKCIANSNDLATFKRWRFLRLATPFCWGVSTHEV
jgi:hypothetical protein